MAELYNFNDLKKRYENFSDPIALITVDEKEIQKKQDITINEVEISITAGFEAGIATIYVGNVYDRERSIYDVEKIKKYFTIGKVVSIALGYGNAVRDVFKGFISQVGFSYKEEEMPLVRVTCMDIKGIMMNSNFNKQLAAKDYSGAVQEIFDKTSLKTLMEGGGFELDLTHTPDHKEAAPATGEGGATAQEDVSPFSNEMVNETDYEFVVRAAKRFNYEFFCVGPVVYFRKARAVKDIIAKIGPQWLIRDFDLEYNITGLVKNIEVRGVNPDKGEVLIASRKLNNKISLGSRAKSLISDAEYVLQDPTITSNEEGEKRLDYLETEIGHRFARLSMELNGTPEFVPGYFMELDNITSAISKKFYIRTVTHIMRGEGGFSTRIEATSPSMDDSWS